MRILTAAVTLLVLAGCAASPRPATIPVVALDQAGQFAGHWRGQLDARDDRLDGPIEFRIEKGGMTILTSPKEKTHVLWIRVQGDKLTGAMSSYFDRERHAEVYTTFEAVLDGAVLRGRLVERIKGEWIEAGTWAADRVTGESLSP
ncbi:MAG: hypothetical protein WA208_06175 [Thermoanaerobaculia bacterium]